MTLQGFFVPGPYDDGDPVTGHYFEMASPDPSRAQVWAYTDAIGYAAGDTLVLHAMSSARSARLVIARDGLTPETVLSTRIDTHFAPTPVACSVNGCNWPEVFRLTIPAGWKSGVYTLSLRPANGCRD